MKNVRISGLFIDGKRNTYRGSGSKEKQLMNILVIGNGFDLAHGLPAKYGDFFEWGEKQNGR